MKVAQINTLWDLVSFVNANKIRKDDIVELFQDRDSYTLVYYG